MTGAMLNHFTKLVKQGSTLAAIKIQMAQEGYSLEAYDDVFLIQMMLEIIKGDKDG